jgi:hypothetical protein
MQNPHGKQARRAAKDIREMVAFTMKSTGLTGAQAMERVLKTCPDVYDRAANGAAVAVVDETPKEYPVRHGEDEYACQCLCAECQDGDCSECSNAKCKDLNCEDCPAQDTPSVFERQTEKEKKSMATPALNRMEAEVSRVMHQRGLSRAEAYAAALKQNPGLYSAYCDEREEAAGLGASQKSRQEYIAALHQRLGSSEILLGTNRVPLSR